MHPNKLFCLRMRQKRARYWKKQTNKQTDVHNGLSAVMEEKENRALKDLIAKISKEFCIGCARVNILVP